MKAFPLRLWLVLLLFLTFGVARADDATPNFSASPRLAISAAEFAKIKASPDFPALRAAAIQAGDALLKNPVTLPDGYGSWIFYYACPDDGATLHALSPTEHQCPVCKKIYSDERTIAAYRCTLHYAAENAAQALGWAYLYSGDEKYVAETKRILLKLAHDYPNYPQRQDRWGHTGIFAPLGGRRYVQSLDEAVGIIKLAKAYDLTRTSKSWTPAEKKQVETDLFGLTAQTLLQFNQDINNHQTWYNAGLMAIASVTGDAALVKRVLAMPGGFRDQLKRSVGRDGLWYEGAMAYHRYALDAMRSIVETGQRLGLNLQDEPKFRAMISAPLHAAYPNGIFPAINDSDPISIHIFDDAFRWARQTYHDPIFDHPQISTQSEDLPDAGLAILRQGTGADAVCTFLDYGQHGEGHGHFDKLNLMLYANGREWLLDPGRLTYSHKEYKTWVKETVAHNTVVVGGKSQNATTGQLLFFQNEKAFAACGVQSNEAYAGVSLRRYLLLTPQFLFDVYEVEGDKTAQLDWLAHAVVPLIRPVEARGDGAPAVAGSENGYQHLLDGKSWKMEGVSRWDFLGDEKDAAAPRLRVWLLDDGPQEILTATGIGYTTDQKAPALIRRRDAASTRFVTAYDLSGRGDAIREIETLPNRNWRLETARGNWIVSFAPDKAEAVFSRGENK